MLSTIEHDIAVQYGGFCQYIIIFVLLIVQIIQKYFLTKDVLKREMYDAWHDDSAKWKFYFLYYNSEDPRIFVNKKVSFLGWTLNWAQPASWLVLLIIAAFAV